MCIHSVKLVIYILHLKHNIPVRWFHLINSRFWKNLELATNWRFATSPSFVSTAAPRLSCLLLLIWFIDISHLSLSGALNFKWSNLFLQRIGVQGFPGHKSRHENVHRMQTTSRKSTHGVSHDFLCKNSWNDQLPSPKKVSLYVRGRRTLCANIDRHYYFELNPMIEPSLVTGALAESKVGFRSPGHQNSEQI